MFNKVLFIVFIIGLNVSACAMEQDREKTDWLKGILDNFKKLDEHKRETVKTFLSQKKHRHVDLEEDTKEETKAISLEVFKNLIKIIKNAEKKIEKENALESLKSIRNWYESLYEKLNAGTGGQSPGPAKLLDRLYFFEKLFKKWNQSVDYEKMFEESRSLTKEIKEETQKFNEILKNNEEPEKGSVEAFYKKWSLLRNTIGEALKKMNVQEEGKLIIQHIFDKNSNEDEKQNVYVLLQELLKMISKKDELEEKNKVIAEASDVYNKIKSKRKKVARVFRRFGHRIKNAFFNIFKKNAKKQNLQQQQQKK